MDNMKLFNVKFTNNSLNTYMKIIKHFMNDKNIVDRNFLNEMLILLIDANEYIDIVSYVRDIKYKTQENKELLNLKSLVSIFIPDLIKNYIIDNNCLIFEYKSVINGKNIIINFYNYYDEKNDYDYDKSVNIYDYYAKLVLMWIYMLSKYSKKRCGKNLRIDIYHTPFIKELPNTEDEVLGPLHANSAFTTNCIENSEIIIFRREEWFKVFIHETMHNFDLDFSLMDQTKFNKNIKKIFSINSKMNIFEGYCDFWARIISSCFNGFIFLMNDKKRKNNEIDKKKFYKICDLFIEVERTFSIYQANKVLKFMGLSYIDFIKDPNINEKYDKTKLLKFKEDTNIFSYYIITAILFVEYNKFIGWCQTNNKSLFKFDNTNKNLNLLEKYIIETHNNNYVLNAFLTMEMIFDNVINKNNKQISLILNSKNKSKKKYYENIKIINNLINTMRMSFIELL